MNIGDLVFINDSAGIHDVNGRYGIIVSSGPNKWKQYKVFVSGLNEELMLYYTYLEVINENR